MPLILPSPERTAFLRGINEHLIEYKDQGDVGALTQAVVAMVTQDDFAQTLKGRPPIETESDLKQVAWAYLYHHLAKRDYVSAALILWGPDTFTPEPRFAQLIWEALFTQTKINVMGAASSGKTFCASAWGILDWILDPEWTRIEVASNSQEHVKKNLYADIVRLHTGASLELPGRIDSDGISLNKKTGHGIFVLVIPGGPRAKGKAKGAKCKSRPKHPIFGKKSRIRFIFDEAQEIAPNIFDDIPNIFASLGETAGGEEDTEHIKVFMAANPKDEFSRYGRNCKPVGGWEKVDDDSETWLSEKGWHTVRLNAMKSENVIAGREIFPRLISRRGVAKIIEEAGSDQDPIVYSQVYAKFPPLGVMSTVIKPEHLRRAEGEWRFVGTTRSLLSFDPAFTGDLPAFAAGRVGMADGWTNYTGFFEALKVPRWVIQLDATGVFVRGDTQDLADEFLGRAALLRVEPDAATIDRTGVGQGVYDVVSRQWFKKVGPWLGTGSSNGGDEDGVRAPVLGVFYGEAASEMKVALEDTRTPKELYDTVATELWMAAGKLFEYDVLRLGRGVEAVTFEELSGRRGGMKVGIGKKLAVEGKKTYKSRTGRPSPDRADALLLCVYAGRMTTPGLLSKAKDTEVVKGEGVGESDGRIVSWEDLEIGIGDMEMDGYQGHVEIEGMKD